MYLLFDGGNGGPNVNKGYGSFIVKPSKHSTHVIHHERVTFTAFPMTNNEAEYNTLIEALTWILDNIDDPESTYGKLLIEGDSELVRSQVLGLWQVRELRMKPLRDKAQSLLKHFIGAEYKHVERSYVVSQLGHYEIGT